MAVIEGAPKYALVALWTVSGALALRNRRPGPSAARGGWWLTAVLAGVIATIQLWHWDVALWQLARRLMRSEGVYAERAWFKLALALVLGLLCLFVLWRYAGVFLRLPLGLPLSLGATLVMVVFILLKTLSLDRVLPRALFAQPGRYLFEFGLVGLVLLGCLLPRKGRP